MRHRLQRYALGLLIALTLASASFAGTAEMVTISSTPTGVTAGLCSLGGGIETALLVQILDATVYYTIHSATATPSAGMGGQAPALSVLIVPKASEFRAVAVSSDARAYAVCVPK